MAPGVDPDQVGGSLFFLSSFCSPVSLSLSLLPLPHAVQYVNMEIKVPSTLILECLLCCLTSTEAG